VHLNNLNAPVLNVLQPPKSKADFTALRNMNTSYRLPLKFIQQLWKKDWKLEQS